MDFSEDMEVDRFNVRDEGEIEVTFKYGEVQNEEGEFEMQYETFEDHVLVWMVG